MATSLDPPVWLRRVLITGAAGEIGTALRASLARRYTTLRLIDRRPIGPTAPGEEDGGLVELEDLPALEAAMHDVDAVIHLGGVPREADWQAIHASNIVGAYHAFEAARRTRVRRFVFASSNHVIGFHRRDRDLDETAPVRPDSRYGASKAFGEALARLYADKHGLEVVCLRIGSFRPRPTDVRMLMTWLSPRDLGALAIAALEAPRIHFEIVYGVSANTRRRWRDRAAERLGYRPTDDAERYAQEILATAKAGADPAPAELYHGGRFCALEFDGDPDRID
jgi:uronate dehydrogenase